ncbi:hypothetical protein Tco_1036409, partial [Tanacetum coccineum]
QSPASRSSTIVAIVKGLSKWGTEIIDDSASRGVSKDQSYNTMAATRASPCNQTKASGSGDNGVVESDGAVKCDERLVAETPMSLREPPLAQT